MSKKNARRSRTSNQLFPKLQSSDQQPAISSAKASYDAVDPLRNEEARQAKEDQAPGDAPEPGQAALVLLAGHPHVHTPQARDDIHGQHNGAEHGELAQDVVGLLGALVHANVDLREIVLVRSRQNPVEQGQRLYVEFEGRRRGTDIS